MAFNEDSRVKLPAILHLCKLGFEYLSLSKVTWNTEHNIFTSIFYESMQSLNPQMETWDIKLLYDELTLTLDNEDLGKSFYEMLTAETGPKIIDFDDFSKNKLQVVTELPCINGDEEFRPDITLLTNGLPLVFKELKKPNNQSKNQKMVELRDWLLPMLMNGQERVGDVVGDEMMGQISYKS